ncbi:uncharacterized protein LOC113016780 [Astatotilapia calliptera]|uniref:uncharacterized protein LOC113016780 n=1 Tax=Astatotilapia calliptera TaxID=8154 RepID=UPI000E405EB0|nr:uncharacterized protein LOC113016780 [Astatotilapia calliptera]
MEDSERKELAWQIRKSLYALTAEELFQIATNITPVPDVDPASVRRGDEESCFDYVCAYLRCKTLLDLEDQGFSHLLLLKDAIIHLIDSHAAEVSHPVVSEENVVTLTTLKHPEQSDVLTSAILPLESVNPQITEYEMLKANYEALGKKLADLQVTSATQDTPTPTITQSLQPRAESVTNSRSTTDMRQSKPDHMVSLRDLPFLQRREFKVHGGQVGDIASDISYHGLCKQIEEGLKVKHTEGEIIQGVLRIIKPGQFKDMLISKDDLTLIELKSLLRSHLSEKSGSELFQELLSTKQHDHETPQQFLYRMIGLKQKVMFASRQDNMDVAYETRTIQNVFLRTIHQGLLPKYSDIRNELKPLLSDYSVSDEALIRQVNKVSSEESERQRRLGYSTRQKVTGQWDVSNEANPEALVGLLLIHTRPEPVDSQTQNHEVCAQKSLLMSEVVGRPFQRKMQTQGQVREWHSLLGKNVKSSVTFIALQWTVY